MKRYLLAALLVGGCGQTARPAIVEPSLTLGPVAGAIAAGEPREQLTAGPTPGVWLLTYRLGDGPEQQDELGLAFEPDGRVTLADGGEAFTDFPHRWTRERVSFEGRPRRDVLGGSGVSRDRVELTVEAPTRMRGTVSLRVNFRWLALPATATLIRAAEAPGALAVEAGTIVDTAAPEAFGD